MKKYLLAATLAALVASPALAATYHRAVRNDVAMQAYAFVPSSDAVVSNGKIIGADPDPAIRTQLLRAGDAADLNGGN
jgi:opacity protein-like surface antigen